MNAREKQPPRSALVTGGNRGIGLAIARSLAESGRRVSITYRQNPPPPGFTAVRCDVTDGADLERALEEVSAGHGPPEIIVSNAGITHSTVITATDPKSWNAVMDTNLTPAFRLARASVSGMLAAGWGRIILVSSVVGLTGSPGQAAYTTSKAAMIGLARTLAWELGPHGITANVVAPGVIDTRMAEGIRPKRREQFISMTPLRRHGTPDDVAEAVRFLASEEASYITGAVIPVSGGLGMGL
ncbi:3-oxoacyl-ACP reductase FabG [Streptomyces lavendulae]|uniref:3-oxoacyl-ACP reductase FabG n=1 Tax=Streptomyces lavendulae TaxID=1914 RepID=UPI003819A03B